MPATPRDLSDLTAAITRLLSEEPRLLAELVSAVTAEGFALGRDPEGVLSDLFDDVDELGSVSVLDDDRYYLPSVLLEGLVLTHTVTAVEIEHDLVLTTPDLLPLAGVVGQAGSDVPVVDGTTLRVAHPRYAAEPLHARGALGTIDDEAWVLERGWYARAGLEAGDLVAVVLLGGVLSIARHTPAATVAEDGGRTRSAVHRLAVELSQQQARRAGGLEIETLVATARANDPTLLCRPVSPLGDLLPRDGFTIQGDFLCLPGVDRRAVVAAAQVQRLRATYRVSEDEALAVLALQGLVDQVAALHDQLATSGVPLDIAVVADAAGLGPSNASPGAGGPGSVRHGLEPLASPGAAEAAQGSLLGIPILPPEVVEATVSLLEPMLPRQVRPTLRWLRATAQERQGRVVDAERTLEEAFSLDPSFSPVLFDLARYASDRGDVERGLSLLRRAGADPDDFLLGLLEEHQAPDRAGLGRNDPCWCGSGRRYKACHRGNERLALPDRANWLYAKGWMYLSDGPGRSLMIELAGIWAEDDSAEGLLDAIDDDVVIDAALFEGGVFGRFLEARGHLLPDDERLLALQWLLVERSVHEIEEVRAGRGFTARDVRTGERADVIERLGSRSLQVGDLVLARFVPDGRDTVVFGPIMPIDLGRRDLLVDLLDSSPDAARLVEFLAAMHAPPTLLNADGTELVLCEALLRVHDVPAVTTWLDAHLAPRHTGERREWQAEVVTDGVVSVRAGCALDGDELTVRSPNEDRFDDILDALIRIDPGIVTVSESRLDPAEGPGLGDGIDLASLTASDNLRDDPEIRAILEEQMRIYEARWLDESIPALGGATPREAADDPTRRGDLTRLLDSFPQTDALDAMSPGRLRRALGLPG